MVRNITEKENSKKIKVRKTIKAPIKRQGCKKSATADPAQKLEQIFCKSELQKPSRTKAKRKPISLKNALFQATSTPCNSVILESLEALRVDQVQRLIIEKKPVISKAPKKKVPIAAHNESILNESKPQYLAIMDVVESEPEKPEPKKAEPKKTKRRPKRPNTNNQSKDVKTAKVKPKPNSAKFVSDMDPINLLGEPKYYIVARKIIPSLKT